MLKFSYTALSLTMLSLVTSWDRLVPRMSKLWLMHAS